MRRRGFTLVEIMLVAAIFATLSIAVFTCLSNGIKLWERGKQLAFEEEAVIFFDRFSSEIRNTFNFSKFNFTGDEFRIDFPAVVLTPADRVSVRADEGIIDQIGRVQYVFDPGRGALLRRQANYSEALHDAWGPEEVVVSAVKGLRFHYFFSASKDPQTSVQPGDPVPSGVEIELTVPGGQDDKVFKRYIAIPAGV